MISVWKYLIKTKQWPLAGEFVEFEYSPKWPFSEIFQTRQTRIRQTVTLRSTRQTRIRQNYGEFGEFGEFMENKVDHLEHTK